MLKIMEKTLIYQRINHVLSTNGTSQNKFAKSANIEQRTINRQLKGEGTLTAPIIEALATQFPSVSMEWLIRGNGSMDLNEPIEPLEPTRAPDLASVRDGGELSIIIEYQRQIMHEQSVLISQLQNELKLYRQNNG